jgi:hypothetical protein
MEINALRELSELESELAPGKARLPTANPAGSMPIEFAFEFESKRTTPRRQA